MISVDSLHSEIYMKFENVKANEVIAKFYFDNHPDNNVMKLLDKSYDNAIDDFFAEFDNVVRNYYANVTSEQIDYFIDSQIYGL